MNAGRRAGPTRAVIVRAAILAIAGAVTAACGSTGSPSASASAGTRTATAPTVWPETRPPGPPRFNTSAGWTWNAAWKPTSGMALAAAAPHAQRIVHVDKVGEGTYQLRGRDARGGQDRWVSAPWRPPAPEPIPNGNGDEIAAVPRLVVVTRDGQDYIGAWTQGQRRDGDPGTTKNVIEVVLFPAAATGDDVAPTHTVVQPIPDDAATYPVQAAGSAILLTWERQLGDIVSTVGIDVLTGEATPYPDGSPTTFVTKTVTPDGPVVGRPGRFELSGRWSSDQVAPEGADSGSGTLMQPAGRYLVARWKSAETPDERPPIWSVHDALTGESAGSVSCQWFPSDFDEGVVASSPDDRYVVLGSLAFDTAERRSFCLTGESERSGVRLTSAGNDGWAFGTAYDPGEENPPATAVVQLGSDHPRVSTYFDDTRPPAAVFATVGFFLPSVPRDPDVAVYPRKATKGGGS